MITSFQTTRPSTQPTSFWSDQPFPSRNYFQSANEELENAARKNEDTSLLLKLGRSIVGKSPGLKEALHQAAIVAPTDSTALIFGETGTGKELVTRAVHELSSRRDKPLVKLNC